MDRIRECAEVSIRRAVGYATFAVCLVLLGFSFDIVLALKWSAGCTMIVSVVLIYKALSAPTLSYRKTETWILLDREHGLPEERAQQVIGGILHEIYKRYASLALAVTFGLWGLSLVLQFIAPRA